MNTFSKALKQIIEAEGDLSECCYKHSKCEFHLNASEKGEYACRAFNLCIKQYNVSFNELISPSNAQKVFEKVLNQVLSELITE